MNAFQKAQAQAAQLRNIKNPAVKHYQQSLILKTLLSVLRGK